MSGGRDYGEAWDIRCFADEINNSSTLVLGEEVEVVDEEDRSTVACEINQEVASRTIKPQYRSHCGPSAWGRSARAEHENAGLCSHLLREVL